MVYAQYMKQYGRALKLLQKSYEEKPTQEMEVTAIKVRLKRKQSWNVERNRESAEQIDLCIKYSNGDMALCRIHQE